MKSTQIIAIPWMAAIFLGSVGFGQCNNCVVVTRYSLGGVAESNPATWPVGLSESITTTVGNNHSKVVIKCIPTTADMGKITVNGDSTNLVWVLVTTETNQNNTGAPASAAARWAGLDDNRGYLRVRAGIDSNMTSDIYLNDTSDIQFLKVGGSMLTMFELAAAILLQKQTLKQELSVAKPTF